MSGIPYPPPTEILPIFDDSVFNVIPATGQTSNILSTNNIFTGVNSFTQNIVGNITGLSSSTSAIALTTDNTSGSYFIPFSKTTASTSNALFIDDTTTPLSYNPSTSNLTASTFTGNLTGNATTTTNATNAINCSTTSTTTAGTYYPVFVSNNVSGNYPNLVGVMTYNPSTNAITANTFNGALSGTATNATNAVIGTDNASTLVYPTFVKTSGAGNKGLFIDDTTTPLSYNPSTGALTTTTFVGALTGTASSATTATNITTTSDNTSGTYYIPFSKTSAGTSTALYLDDTTGPLSYNPSTSNLSASIFTGSANITNALNTYTFVATTLTLDFSTLTFKNFYNSTAITSAITQSAVAFSNAVAGGSYMIYITTGVGGSFTFNTGISGVKTTFSTAFTIPASSVGVMNIYYINSVYIVGINILT